MPSIEHVAIWSADIERLRAFYTRYLCGIAGQKYTNRNTGFQSYFVTFDSGARLELMQSSAIPANLISPAEQYQGIIHLAFAVGSAERVDELTAQLAGDGYTIASAPRHTGDGYYESCVLDPDGNRIEITA